MINNVIKVVLLVVILVLAFLVFESIMRPVRFNQEVNKRNNAVIQQLKDIRTAQMAYRNIHGTYTNSFDTLLTFLNEGFIPVVKMVPDPEDTTYTKTIRDTIGFIPVADSLYGNRPNFQVDALKVIRYSDNEVFDMDAGTIERGGVAVNVFEASAHFNTFLKGLNRQMVVNLIAARDQLERFPGLKVGSMVDASLDGNWE
jgi:type II secretory pathway pseudopilin PulG